MEPFVVGLLILLFIDWLSIRKLCAKTEKHDQLIRVILALFEARGELKIEEKDNKIEIQFINKERKTNEQWKTYKTRRG